MKNSKSNIKFIIITLAVIILLFVLLLLPKNVPANPDGTIGNTAGNLNNKGLFCENDGRVYFSNAYDEGAVYSMNPDETDMKKLSSASAEYINAAGKYLYYYQTNLPSTTGLGSFGSSKGVYRMKTNGKKLTCLDKNIIVNLNLVDNTLFYQRSTEKEGIQSRRISTNKKDPRQSYPELFNPACAAGSIIYFNGTETNFNLHSFNTITETDDIIWEYDVYNPVIDGEYIYFMDVHNDYRLGRYMLSTGEMQLLTDKRIDFFNVYQGIVYYQISSEDSPALMRMNGDGSNRELIKDGNFQNINITSNYVYFNEFNNTVPVYKTSTFGAVNVSTFDTARDAVIIKE